MIIQSQFGQVKYTLLAIIHMLHQVLFFIIIIAITYYLYMMTLLKHE
jgi:hypothetical protein